MPSPDQRRAKTHAGHGDPTVQVQALESVVRQARERLIAPSPANLDECRGRLEEAVNALRQLQMTLPGNDPVRNATLRAPLAALRAEIARLKTLLDNAAAFHHGWMRLAASIIAGYQADGNPAPTETIRRVWLEV